MTRGELIAALNQLNNQLVDIITVLKDYSEPAARVDDTKCSIHGVPWRQYKFGWAHPPAKPGDKWCYRDKK